MTNAVPRSASDGRWAAVIALFLAAFMNLLDVTVVNLALPAIRQDLDATSTQLEWVLVVYVLTFAAGLLPFGRFGDVFGRDRIFLVGVAGFVLSSIACGLASDIVFLIVARGVQGLSAAMMVPQVLAIVHGLFQAEERGRVIGMFGAISGLGAVAGPLIGGVIVSADIAGLGWRPIFLLNVPLGLLSFAGAVFYVPKLRSIERIEVDWQGALFFALAITCVTFPLVEGRQFGWPWWCYGLLALSVVFAAIFLTIQKGRAISGTAQLLPTSLIADRSFVFGLSVVTLFFSGIAGVMFMMAIFLQTGFGLTALEAGIALAPHPAGAMIASFFTGRIGSRWLELRVLGGACLLFAGMIWLRAVVAGEAIASSSQSPSLPLLLFPPLLIVGLGMGTAIAALFQSVLTRVRTDDAGAGSGILQAFQQVGIAIGIAVIGQIYFTSLTGRETASSYQLAAGNALWFPIAVYLLLIALSLALMRKGREKRR